MVIEIDSIHRAVFYASERKWEKEVSHILFSDICQNGNTSY